MDQNGFQTSLLVLLTLLALGLRLVGLNWQPLWWDEGYSLYAAGMPIGKMIVETAEDIHPPFYYALLHMWSQFTGMGPASARLFSVFIGVVTVLILFLLARHLGGRKLAWATGLLAAINPFLIYYSQEVRMYALTALLGLVSTYFMFLWLENQGSPNVRAARLIMAGYLLATGASLYTHYYTVFIPLAQTIFVVVVYRHRDKLKEWLICQGLLIILYLPWVVFTLSKLTSYVSGKVSVEKSSPLGPLDFLRHHFTAFSLGHLPPQWTDLYWGTLLFLLLAALGVLKARQTISRSIWTTFGPILLLVSLFGAYMINLVYPFHPSGFERLLLFAAPAYCLLLALGCVYLWQAKRIIAILAFVPLITTNGLSLWAFYNTPRYVNDDYRPLIARMRIVGQPEDVVLNLYPWQIGYFHAYYGPADLYQEPAFKQDWPARQNDPNLLPTYIDNLMARHERVWFPAHQTGGRILEEELATYLSKNYHTALSEWPNPHTRLYLFSSDQDLKVSEHSINFGNRVRLMGYGLSSDAVTSDGGIVNVELDWQLISDLKEPYYVGLRLSDSTDYTWAQRSAEPVGGFNPFGDWASGEVIRDKHGLLVPADIAPGRYTVKVGVYRRSDGLGLDVLSSAGISQGVEAELGTVEIVLSDKPPAVDRLQMSQPHSVDLMNARGEAIRLLGYSLSETEQSPGSEMPIALFWQPLTEITQDNLVNVQLVDESGIAQVSESYPPVSGQYPTSKWWKGYPVRDPQRLLLPPDLPPGKYGIRVGLLQPGNGQGFTIKNSDQTFIEMARIDVVGGRSHNLTPLQVPIELKATWGESIRLLGYGPFPTHFGPGEMIELPLYWQALSAMSESYTVFVHLLDENQFIRGQVDSVPGKGTLPTTSWIPGEYLQDTYSFQIKPDTPEGTYHLEIGIYNAKTGNRLPVHFEGHVEVSDHILLPEDVSVVEQ